MAFLVTVIYSNLKAGEGFYAHQGVTAANKAITDEYSSLAIIPFIGNDTEVSESPHNRVWGHANA